jgi:DNA-binding response OmpR family regulator
MSTSSTKQALIIDDSADTREFLTLLLEKQGFEVFTASDGDDGLETFRKHRPDVVITDIFMPNKEGLEVITEIRNIDEQIGIIAISGYKDNNGGMDYLEVAKQFGAQATLEKPFDNEELMKVIEEVI